MKLKWPDHLSSSKKKVMQNGYIVLWMKTRRNAGSHPDWSPELCSGAT